MGTQDGANVQRGRGGSAEEPLRCAVCGLEVSSRSHLFAHTPRGPVEVFVNPSGRFCELLTLRQAWGWTAVCDPTEEATWFPGYAWEIIVCSRCRSHLGWRYLARQGGDPAAFFGLLREALLAGLTPPGAPRPRGVSWARRG